MRSLSFVVAPLVALLAAVIAVSDAQSLPSESQCRQQLNAIGQNNLLIRLSPCQGGPSPSCCQAAQGVGGLKGNAPLGGCLCIRSLYDELLSGVTTNPLARAAGVTQQQVTNSLQSCGVPFVAGMGGATCPSGGGGGGGGSPAPSAPVTGAAPPAAGGSPSPSPGRAGPAAAPLSTQVGAAPTSAPSAPAGLLPPLPIGRGGLIQAAARQAVQTKAQLLTGSGSG